MKIGCDLDGVIIDHSYNQALMLAECGIIMPRADITKQWLRDFFTPEQYELFKQELYDVRSSAAQEIQGALRALYTLTYASHNICIISRRIKSSNQALQWLDAHGYLGFIPREQIHFVSTYEDKETICLQQEIDVLIDDSPEVFDTLHTPRVRILFDPFSYHGNQQNIFLAHSWADVLSIIIRQK